MSVYHYFMTSQGQLIHENIVIEDESLIELVYKNMEINNTTRFPEAKYYAKIGYEEIFLQAEDTPMVFRHFIDNTLFMTHSIMVPFSPKDLRFSKEGNLYHRCPIGSWGRISSQALIQMSRYIEKWGPFYMYKDATQQRIIEPIDIQGLTFLHPKTENQCFGCGAANPFGLKMTFVFDEINNQVETWLRPPMHMMGSLGIMHGGMVSLLLDEAMGKVLSGNGIKAPTGNLAVRYHKPTYLNQELNIKASLISDKGRKLLLQAEIHDENGQLTASGEGLFIRLK